MSGILLLIGIISFGIMAAFCIPFYIDLYRAMTGKPTNFDDPFFSFFKLLAILIPFMLLFAVIYASCQ